VSQRRGLRVAMTAAERDDFLDTSRTGRVATASPDGRPHVAPLWYVWDGARIWLYSVVRSQRWVDISRNPRCSVVIDDGDTYGTLRGVELSGVAEVVGEVPRVGEPNPALNPIEDRFWKKYGSGTFRYDGGHAWLSVRPDHQVSWDFRKL
jgi:PPOX class probable F420-dependent enzyme